MKYHLFVSCIIQIQIIILLQWNITIMYIPIYTFWLCHSSVSWHLANMCRNVGFICLYVMLTPQNNILWTHFPPKFTGKIFVAILSCVLTKKTNRLIQWVINNSCSIDKNYFLEMFPEPTSSFFSLGWWTDKKTRELETYILFGEDDTLWCVKTVFLLYLFECGDSVVLKFERCEHRDDTSIVEGDQEGVKC